MKRTSIQNLIVLVMITIYLTGSGFVVLTGAQFYTTMVKENELSLNRQTALLYFNNRIKQHDGLGIINVITQNNITALCFTQNDYTTLLYEVDGYLVEQSSETALIDPIEAQKVIALSKLKFSFKVHELIISYTDTQGENIQLSYALLSIGDPS